MLKEFRKSSYFYSSVLAIVTNITTILSGATTGGIWRAVAGSFNMIGNALGGTAGWFEIKYGNGKQNTNEVLITAHIPKPGDKVNWAQAIGQDNDVRNKLTYLPRLMGSICMAYSGHDTGREAEMWAGAMYMAVNSIRLSRYNNSFVMTGPVLATPALFLAYSGYKNRDPYQFINGLLNFSYGVTSMFVENNVQKKTWKESVTKGSSDVVER